MEKFLTIDRRQVKFKSTGAYLLKYKAQTGRDALQDIYKLQSAVNKDGQIASIEALDLGVFYDLVWVLAKTADPNIPPPMEWLDTFSEFPLLDILTEIMDLVTSCLGSTVASKKK